MKFQGLCFCRFPQSVFWDDLRDHLQKLSGVGIKEFADDPIIGSWIDFIYCGCSFTINAEGGEFMFFATDVRCPDLALDAIVSHFAAFFDSGGK